MYIYTHKLSIIFIPIIMSMIYICYAYASVYTKKNIYIHKYIGRYIYLYMYFFFLVLSRPYRCAADTSVRGHGGQWQSYAKRVSYTI